MGMVVSHSEPLVAVEKGSKEGIDVGRRGEKEIMMETRVAEAVATSQTRPIHH